MFDMALQIPPRAKCVVELGCGKGSFAAKIALELRITSPAILISESISASTSLDATNIGSIYFSLLLVLLSSKLYFFLTRI